MKLRHYKTIYFAESVHASETVPLGGHSKLVKLKNKNEKFLGIIRLHSYKWYVDQK